MMQPLVSILIPTHNRLELFKVAFHSAINQTYKNIEIVISDDSDNDETYQYIQDYLSDQRIKYQWNKGFDTMQNWQWVLEHCNGDYFNYLLDDDVFAPDKIEKMVEIYEQYPNVSLVTSYRQPIDIDGNYLRDITATMPIVDNSAIISGDTIYFELLRSNTNFIGELTTVLLRAEYKELVNSILELNTVLPDVTVWLELCEKGDIAYLTETLSYFRLHSGNDQLNPFTQLAGYSEWSKLYYVAYLKTNIDERKNVYLNMHIDSLVKMIKRWLGVLRDDSVDKGALRKHRHLVDEAVEIYLNFSRGLEDWQMEPEIRDFIVEYEEEMKTKTEQKDTILGLLEKTDKKVKVLIIESLEYIRPIRDVMPNADILVAVSDDSSVDDSAFDGLGVHWIKGDYLSDILPVEEESIDLIIGDELFLKSDLMLEALLAFCSYLSETGYLVTWFRNASYWRYVVNMLEGHPPQSISRLFTDEVILKLLEKAYFEYVDLTSAKDCTAEGMLQIERLMSMDKKVEADELAAKKWFVKAAKFDPDRISLKKRYDKKVRWELVTRLRRVEYGIEVIENTVGIIDLLDSAKMELSDVSRYVSNHVNHISTFISNLAPGFYRSGRLEIFRELLHSMVDVYQDHADYDTIVEWKKRIDVLDECPDTLLPTSPSKSIKQRDSLKIAPENKVAFIACVNSEEWYHEWQLYINNLEVPDGMAIELLPIWGAKSVCQGYNMGMKQTDAKYKVYLHQDVLIANKNIIKDMLDIFADSTIGALGVVGAQTLPSNGVWWDAQNRVGSAMQVNDPESLCNHRYPEFNGKCVDVDAVDGILIATQVDIWWREDLFTGWHFYDVSQCQEMKRHGYRVVVPKQDDYWVIHCSAPKLMDYSYEEYNNVFVNEYIK